MMLCTDCGNENDDDSVVCNECGTPLNFDTRLISCDEGAFTSKYLFKDISYEDLAQIIHEIFIEKGYKLKKGDIGNAVYKKGSSALSFLTKGVTNRSVFEVNVYPESDYMGLQIKTPKFSGSLHTGTEFNDVKKKIKMI